MVFVSLTISIIVCNVIIVSYSKFVISRSSFNISQLYQYDMFYEAGKCELVQRRRRPRARLYYIIVHHAILPYVVLHYYTIS